MAVVNILPDPGGDAVPYARVTIEWSDGMRFEASRVEVVGLDAEPVYQPVQPGREFQPPQLAGAQILFAGLARIEDGQAFSVGKGRPGCEREECAHDLSAHFSNGCVFCPCPSWEPAA